MFVMLLRSYKTFVRILLFLMSLQFLLLGLTPCDASRLTKKECSIETEHSKSFLLSVFYESNKTERESEDEDERLLHCVEIADLSSVSLGLIHCHTPVAVVSPIEQQYDLKPPLFKLHHIYLI